jgi:hypothetical protein
MAVSSDSSFRSRLCSGDIIDCFGPSKSLSSANQPPQLWRAANIVAIQGTDDLIIHFDNLSSDLDEVIKRDSARIAPFKTKTANNNEAAPSATGKQDNNPNQPANNATTNIKSPSNDQAVAQPRNPSVGGSNINANPNITANNPPAYASSASSNSNQPSPAATVQPQQSQSYAAAAAVVLPPAESTEMIAFRKGLAVGSLIDFYVPRSSRWETAEIVAAVPPNKIQVVSMVTGQLEAITKDSIRIAQPMTKSTEPHHVAPAIPTHAKDNQHANPSHHHHQQQPQQSHTSSAANAAPMPTEISIEFTAGLKVGDFCDCYDTDRVWRLAEIVGTQAAAVKVHYIGWQDKWDEWIDRASPRVQPPRTKAEGYTGPPGKEHQAGAAPGANNASNPNQVASNTHFQPPAFKPSYDCFSQCRWKRVLSTGLGHREIESLDKLFARCCSVQDDYQDHLLGQRPTLQQFIKSLTELENDINQVKAALKGSAIAAQYVAICESLAATLRSSIIDEEESSKRQLLQSNEDFYMKRLEKHFKLVEIPSNGNCLFTAAGIGHIRRQNEVKSQHGDTKEDFKHSAPEDQSTPPLIFPVTNGELDEDHIAREYRAKCVTFLRQTPTFHHGIVRELQDAVAHSDANTTSKQIVAEFHRNWPSGDVKQHISDEKSLDIYAAVMGKDGIYGTGLEVEALAELLRVPIHVYFRQSSEQDKEGSSAAEGVKEQGRESEILPAQIVGENYAGPPIRLAYYMGNKHYNLLVNKSPQPAHEQQASSSATTIDNQVSSGQSDQKNSSAPSGPEPGDEPGGEAPSTSPPIQHHSSGNPFEDSPSPSNTNPNKSPGT